MAEEIGFPPGMGAEDYFPINGGFPPFRGWYWPDDFSEEQRALFWRAASGDETYETMAAYNTVGGYNGGDQTGKAGTGRDVESFQRQAFLYSVPDEDDEANWPARTRSDNGYTENGYEVRGTFADGWFYPEDQSAAEMVPPDWNG